MSEDKKIDHSNLRADHWMAKLIVRRVRTKRVINTYLTFLSRAKNNTDRTTLK